jgi:hypothetical protein
MYARRTAAACLIAAALVWSAPAATRADDLPVFRIDLADGRITPERIEVPANTRFKLELHNTGTTPVEFESLELRKEKVLGPGAESFIVIRNLAPGEYRFFDDFHPDAGQAVLVAQ